MRVIVPENTRGIYLRGVLRKIQNIHQVSTKDKRHSLLYHQSVFVDWWNGEIVVVVPDSEKSHKIVDSLRDADFTESEDGFRALLNPNTLRYLKNNGLPGTVLAIPSFTPPTPDREAVRKAATSVMEIAEELSYQSQVRDEYTLWEWSEWQNILHSQKRALEHWLKRVPGYLKPLMKSDIEVGGLVRINDKWYRISEILKKGYFEIEAPRKIRLERHVMEFGASDYASPTGKEVDAELAAIEDAPEPVRFDRAPDRKPALYQGRLISYQETIEIRRRCK